MHDAHLGCVFFFLDILAEYTLLSMTVMVTPCLWYVVGMKLVMSCVKFFKPLLQRAPCGECRPKTPEFQHSLALGILAQEGSGDSCKWQAGWQEKNL